MLPRALVVSLLSLLCVSLAAQPADAGSTVLAFFERWGAGDVEGAARYWADPASDDFHHHVRRVLATSCIALHEARVLGVTVLAGDTVEVEAGLWVTRRNAMPGARERPELRVVHLRLRQSGGTWRIEEWTSGEEREVDELLREPDSAARARWLDGQMDRWSPALAEALMARAIALSNQDALLLAHELTAYLDRMGTALGDDVSRSVALAAANVLERRELRPDHQRSLALAREALALAERTGDPDLIAPAITRLVWALTYTRSPAGDALERVLKMAGFVADESVPATAATQLSAQADKRGDQRTALLYAASAERYARAARSPRAMLSAALNFAGAYTHMGDFELAALHYERAGQLALENGFHRIYASMIREQAYVTLWLHGESDDLLRRIDAGLAVPGVQETPWLRADLYVARAAVNVELGKFDEAEADLAEAFGHDDAPLTAEAYAWLVRSRLRREQYASALDAAVPAGVAAWPGDVADALRGLGQIDAAIDVARCSVEIIGTRLRELAGDPRQQQMFLSSVYSLDQTLVELLVERGAYEAALDAAEDAKARLLLTAAARSGQPVVASGGDAKQRLSDEVERLNRAVVAETDAARLAALQRELGRARLELSDMEARIAANVATSSGHGPAAATTSVAWHLPDVVAVEYLVGARRTMIFVVRAAANGLDRKQLDVRVVDVPRTEISALIRQLRERIGTRDLRYTEPARRLYALLVAPVEPFLGSAKTICIIPDGDLWKLPFHTLQNDQGTLLLDRAAVFYAPSIRMLLATARKSRPREVTRLLAFGNPSIGRSTAERFRAIERSSSLGDLAEAETEVGRIARLYGRERSAVHVRGDAREALFKQQAPDFDVLHIASHGLVDDAAPMFSALVLATAQGDREDGLLEAREVLELELDADLVVLSACDTATGRIGGGEGILGLSWAFLAAGARGLVGSQWKAPSAAAEALMVKFHERLVAGDSPAEALRAAQRSLMATERYAAPLDWAPFIVVGNGLGAARW